MRVIGSELPTRLVPPGASKHSYGTAVTLHKARIQKQRFDYSSEFHVSRVRERQDRVSVKTVVHWWPLQTLVSTCDLTGHDAWHSISVQTAGTQRNISCPMVPQ